jgi:hypothetical protein
MANAEKERAVPPCGPTQDQYDVAARAVLVQSADRLARANFAYWSNGETPDTGLITRSPPRRGRSIAERSCSPGKLIGIATRSDHLSTTVSGGPSGNVGIDDARR